MRKRKRRTVRPDRRWLVVEVWRGLPESVRLFRSEVQADSYAEKLRAEQDEAYDEVGIFEVRV